MVVYGYRSNLWKLGKLAISMKIPRPYASSQPWSQLVVVKFVVSSTPQATVLVTSSL